MSIEFDREAVGVQEQARWEDAAEFGRLTGFVRGMQVRRCVSQLPAHVSSAGSSELRSALREFKNDMEDVLGEFSDTCSMLGSGAKDAAGDFDDSERLSAAQFEEMNALLGGGQDL